MKKVSEGYTVKMLCPGESIELCSIDGSALTVREVACGDSPWTSVLDAMPNRYQKVLTLDANGEITVGMLKIDGFKYVGCYDDCCHCSNGNVTHWMELPCPPK